MEMFMWKETNGYHHNPTVMSSYCASSSSAAIGLGYIEHPISKLDTLAGVAIKYGVEVADIRKLNGLVTDSQMFALKILHIPLHGRNSNGNSPTHHASHELLQTFQSPRMNTSEQKLSSPVNSSRGYYGTVPAMKESIREVLEIVMCRQGSSSSSEKSSFYANSCMSDRPLSHHKKSRSLAERNFDIFESSDKWIETIAKNLEASQKDTPELLLRHDNSSSCGLPSKAGKGLAHRQKGASRITLTATKAVTVGVGDAYTSSTSSVRKSSSTSCLQGNNNSSKYMRSTSRRSLKPDLIASTASMAKPILCGGRYKAALD